MQLSLRSLVLGTALAAALAAQGAAPAGAAIVAGFNSNTLAANDDGSTGAVSLGFSLNFFGITRSTAFVNNNGNITFDAPLSTFTPFGLTSTNRQILAPFFADVDTRGAGSGLVTYGTGTFAGQAAFGVNWLGVGYFAANTDKLNSFQLLLVDRSDTGAGNADVYFNYGSIQWETGDASGGSGGLGGACARVGYSNGAGTSVELTGSGICGAFLDGGPNALVNLNDTGQRLFEIRNGVIVAPVPEPASLALFGVGLAGVALTLRRRQPRREAA